MRNPLHMHTTADEPISAGRKRPLRVAALLLLSVLLMGGFVYALWHLRQDELADEQENLRRLGITLAEQTELAFREIDLVLQEARPFLTPAAMNKTDKTLHTLLHNHFSGLKQGQALMAFGPDGVMRGHSREFPTPQITINDRDYFLAQKPSGDTLFISAPMRNRVNKRWMISLSRRISTAEDNFAGVIMAAVDMDYFSRLYQSLKLPPEARLLLCHNDGTVLAAYPFDEGQLGKPLKPGIPPTVIGVTMALRSQPLTLLLTLPKEVALQNWRRHMFAAIVGMLAIAAAIAALNAQRRAHSRALGERTKLLLQSEQALRESETRYRTIVETANEGICSLDQGLRFTYVNQVMTQMLGYSEVEMLGRPVTDFLEREQAEPEGTAPLPWSQEDCIQQERLFRAKNGSEVWAIVSSTPLIDESGELRGSFAMLADITRRKEEEKYREGIASILRHDLRSPLAAMFAIPQMLLGAENLDDQQRWCVLEMKRYVKLMLRMVDAYLQLSNIETGGVQAQTKPVDILALLKEVQVELGPLFASGQATLGLACEGVPLAPADTAMVMGEEVLCQTMLVNLIKNALEASPRGAVINISLCEAEGSIILSVRNQGAVPESIRSRFFQKYVTAGKRNGTGLGAYSARMIAEAFGGGIALDTSEPGYTTIRVTLPKAA